MGDFPKFQFYDEKVSVFETHELPDARMDGRTDGLYKGLRALVLSVRMRIVLYLDILYK